MLYVSVTWTGRLASSYVVLASVGTISTDLCVQLFIFIENEEFEGFFKASPVELISHWF